MSYFIKDPTRSGPPGPLVVGDSGSCCSACAQGASACGDSEGKPLSLGILAGIGVLFFLAWKKIR